MTPMTAPSHPPRHRSARHRAVETDQPVAPVQAVEAAGRWWWSEAVSSWVWVPNGMHLEHDPVTGQLTFVRDGYELVLEKPPSRLRGWLTRLFVALVVAALLLLAMASAAIWVVRQLAEPVPGPTPTVTTTTLQ